MKKWDVFISHASEDKQAVALPLAETLIRAGLKVWLDRFELRVGDSLRERIDEGLSESAFGVVVLSEHFLNKGWPKKELNGLFALEEEGVKVILPVWHGIDKATVARYSPILADRLAADTKDSVPAVARTIAQVVLEEGARLRSRGGTLANQLIGILDQGPSPRNVSAFLSTYPKVLPMASGHFGLFPDETLYLERPDLGEFSPDLAVGNFIPTPRVWGWQHFFFCPVEGPFFEQGSPVGALKQAIEKLQHLQGWLADHMMETVNSLLPADKGGREGWTDPRQHKGVILVGRRDRLSEGDREGIRSIKDLRIEVRSYDWLVEACTMAERAHESRGHGSPFDARATDEL